MAAMGQTLAHYKIIDKFGQGVSKRCQRWSRAVRSGLRANSSERTLIATGVSISPN